MDGPVIPLPQGDGRPGTPLSDADDRLLDMIIRGDIGPKPEPMPPLALRAAGRDAPVQEDATERDDGPEPRGPDPAELLAAQAAVLEHQLGREPEGPSL